MAAVAAAAAAASASADVASAAMTSPLLETDRLMRVPCGCGCVIVEGMGVQGGRRKGDGVYSASQTEN
jgi:hypothetical protein